MYIKKLVTTGALVSLVGMQCYGAAQRIVERKTIKKPRNGATPGLMEREMIKRRLAEVASDEYMRQAKCNLQLWQSVRDGDITAINTLIEAKADVNQPNVDGKTPLFVATEEGHQKMVELLVESNANVDKGKPKDGLTPLHRAAEKGYQEIVEFLIRSRANIKADLEVASFKYCRTPLFMAATNGHQEIVEVLAEANADVNPKVKYPPLIEVILRGDDKWRIQMIKKLIKCYHYQLQRTHPLHIIENDEVVMFAAEGRPAEGVGNLSIIPNDIIEFHITMNLSPQNLAAFRLVSKGCRALARIERGRQMVSNNIKHKFNASINDALRFANGELLRRRSGWTSQRQINNWVEKNNDVITILENALQQEYVKQGTSPHPINWLSLI